MLDQVGSGEHQSWIPVASQIILRPPYSDTMQSRYENWISLCSQSGLSPGLSVYDRQCNRVIWLELGLKASFFLSSVTLIKATNPNYVAENYSKQGLCDTHDGGGNTSDEDVEPLGRIELDNSRHWRIRKLFILQFKFKFIRNEWRARLRQ